MGRCDCQAVEGKASLKVTHVEQVRNEIHFIIRQFGAVDAYPARVPMTAALREMVDEPTAQRIYEELLAEIELKAGIKIERK